MAVIKKVVKDSIEAKLIKIQDDLRYKLKQNAQMMKKLVEESTKHKREIAALGDLIKGMNPK